MADVAGTPAPPTPPALPPQKPTWSEPAFRAGLYVGIGLLIVGLLAQTFLLAPYIVALLVICSGLGIIFGAFGSLAVLQYKGLVIAGVATIAIALLVLVNQLSDSLLRIRLDGDVKGASIVLSGDETYPAADRKTSVEFFVLAQTIDVERLALLVTLPSEKAADGTLTPSAEINFECIPAASIRPFLGSGRPLQWRFDAKRRVLTGLSGVDKGIVLDGPCREEGEPVTASIGASSFSPVSSAFAQGQSVESLLADLNSDSTVVRRDARLALSALGPIAVRPMMDYWAKNSDDYRIQLGVSVALTEYLRDHKDQRRDVSALLTDTDFTLIARAIGDPDRTLRAYVTEFLRDLADPRIIAAARNSFVAASPQGKFNYVFAINGVIDDLGAQQKADIRTLLDAWRKMVGTQTQVEIDKVLARL